MADLLDFAPVRVFTSNAAPGAGYIARFYQSGTTTPVTVYSDSSLTTPLGSSVTADASGVFPAVWSTGGTVKCTIETPAGAVVHTVDPVQSITAGAAASQISFSPTVDIPETNVQDAIEAAAASAASGFTPFGLGVTGSVALIANLDATNIASGQYRFDATTTGTYPTGVAAANTGAVVMVRETAGSGWMVMYHDTTDRVWFRRMNASTWGTWRENLTVNQPITQGDLFYRGAANVERLAIGTARQVLQVNSGATAPEWGTGGPIMLTQADTTSGTVFDFTVPNTATEIFVMCDNVSLSGTDNIIVQLIDGGGAQNTGYVSAAALGNGSSVTNTTGFVVFSGAAAASFRGTMTILKMSGNKWLSSTAGAAYSSGTLTGGVSGSGVVTLDDACVGVRVTRTGANTFDLGSVNVGYR